MILGAPLRINEGSRVTNVGASEGLLLVTTLGIEVLICEGMLLNT